jgi:hypothetical protein
MNREEKKLFMMKQTKFWLIKRAIPSG